jgi:hypothetical protein
MPRLTRRTATVAAALTAFLVAVPAAQAAPTAQARGFEKSPLAASLDLLQAVWGLWTANWAATTAEEADGGTIDNAGARIDGNGLVDLSGARIDGNGDAGARIDGNGSH